jgi:hypothetical protein
VTRRGRLLDRILELEAVCRDVTQMLGAPYPAISFQLRGGGPLDDPLDDITLQRRLQRDGSVRWVIYRFGTNYALTRDGTWTHEPIPSSRTDDYRAWTRFATITDALDHFHRFGNRPYLFAEH